VYRSLVLCCAVKSADTVSLTSCDSSDSAQLSTEQAPAVTSSTSALTEDCRSESGQCKLPSLMGSINLELLRQQEPILEILSPPVCQSPKKLVVNLATESTANDADDNTRSKNCDLAVHNGECIPDGLDQTSGADDDNFESIYSLKPISCGDKTSPELSLDDAIMRSLMTSRPDEFRDVVRPVLFTDDSAGESSNENGVCIEARQITVPQFNSCTRLSSVNGTNQSMVVGNWIQLPAPTNIKSVSVSSRHVWITDIYGQMFYSLLRGPGLRWLVVTTAPAQQVSVSPSGSLIWRLDSGSAYAALNVSTRLPWGNKWSEVARDVTWISVDSHVAW